MKNNQTNTTGIIVKSQKNSGFAKLNFVIWLYFKFDIFNNNSKGIVVSYGWGINVFYIDEEKNSVIYGTTDGSVILYDFNENKEKLKIGDERTPVLTMCIDNGETIIAFGNAKGRVIMISLEDYSLVRDCLLYTSDAADE